MATVVVATVLAAAPVHAADRLAACPRYAAPQRIGSLSLRELNEVSGLEASRRSPVLWLHEDSGNPARVYAIRRTGRVVATVQLGDATNTDWEDLALAGGRLWVGDIGDNGRRRNGVRVYRFREPAPTSRTISTSVLSLRYEDGAHDAEAMVVDAERDALFVITKELSSGRGRVYRASIARLHDGSTRTLRRIGSVPIGSVTAADLTPAGLLVKNYDRGLLFRWTDDRTVRSAIGRTPCAIDVGGGETITFRRADRGIYGIPEGGRAPVWSSPRR